MKQNGRPAALVLSGGGAKGSFQVGAEEVLRRSYGYQWTSVHGVSVGALNGSMIAAGEYGALKSTWLGIEGPGDIYSGGLNPWRVLQLLLKKKVSIYDLDGLREILERELGDVDSMAVPFRPGYVNLETGRYESPRFFGANYEPADLVERVYYSAIMPIVWEPGKGVWVDGGLRNITPLSDALEEHPSEIVVVQCQPEEIKPADDLDAIHRVALRSLDVILREVWLNDVDRFVQINELVQAHGATHPGGIRKLGRYRYVPIRVIRPEEDLGESLDFSPGAIRRRVIDGRVAADRAMEPGEPDGGNAVEQGAA